MGNQERHKALKDLQRDVFLSIAVLVERQSEQMDDIELKVAGAGAYTNGGTNALFHAKLMKKRRGRWVCWIGLGLWRCLCCWYADFCLSFLKFCRTKFILNVAVIVVP
ncbi:syntaxin-112-like [Prunus yedoensis var. nudiflora]|uniref:Syntaxin-112-like n=1 Tax=Prunus yedoensis var. nudiflora TaxID=2094558 RepID=A0A314YL97_PRUYE|nr:syntaxin-112-like [Prunus yedoensis var. nudiflora]